jgi:dihydrofolate reductase
MERKVILYIAMSLDGYIAKHDDNIDFLSIVEAEGEDYGHANFLHVVDTVIWGRRTLDKVLSFGEGVPYKDKAVYVISKSRTGNEEHAVYTDDLPGLIKEMKSKPGKDIYCDGGGDIVFELLQQHLLNRIIISVIPHLLGDGIRLFKNGRPEQSLFLTKSISFPSGLVQLWYDVGLAERRSFLSASQKI